MDTDEVAPDNNGLEIHARKGEMEGDGVAENVDEVAPAAREDPWADDEITAKWVTAATHKRISAAIGATPNVVCGECGHTCTSRTRLLCHARVHRVHSFCRCGYSSKWRESIRKHQADKRNRCDRDGPVYEVDRAS